MVAITIPDEADTLANALHTSLTADVEVAPVVNLSDATFTFTPDSTSDLYKTIKATTLDELTQVDLNGVGIFDKLMASVDLHIKREYNSSRIVGDEYAAVYTQIMTAVLNESTRFLLQKDQSKWSAITAQMNARVADIQATTARIGLEKIKVETQKAIFDMQNSGSQYALTKMQLANTDANYYLVKAQTELAKEQKEVQRSQTQDNRSDNTTPVTGLVGRQRNLISEQIEAERSKTLDTRSDNSTIVRGSVGKQKDLYTQQIDSFIKDAKQKAAKMYLDGWTVQKTLDANLASPNELDVPSVSNVLLSLRNENGL